MQKIAGDCIQQIKEIDFNQLEISEYNRQYIHRLLPHLEYYFQTYINALSSFSSEMQKGQLIVDFGGGHGFLSLFLKSLGYSVIYCDHNPLSVSTITLLKEKLGFGPDYIIEGSSDELNEFCRQNQLIPSRLIATDLIEHVYDLSVFFNELKQINSSFEMVFTTGSNPLNFYKCSVLRKEMQKEEKTYLIQRKEYIENNHSDLNEIQIQQLAYLTRGKTYSDIQKAVVLFKETNIYPQPSSDIYNTCAPETGNWEERILSLKEYQQIAAKEGFQIKFRAGFYNDKRAGFCKSFLSQLLNFFIKHSGKLGFILAPYILLHVDKASD